MFRFMLLVLPLIIATVHGATIGGTNTDESVCASISSSCDADGTFQFDLTTSYPVYKCATCGFSGLGSATGNGDCYTCPAGKQLAVLHADCTGYCIDPSNADVFNSNGRPTFENSACYTPATSYPVNCDTPAPTVMTGLQAASKLNHITGEEDMLVTDGQIGKFVECGFRAAEMAVTSSGQQKSWKLLDLPQSLGLGETRLPVKLVTAFLSIVDNVPMAAYVLRDKDMVMKKIDGDSDLHGKLKFVSGDGKSQVLIRKGEFSDVVKFSDVVDNKDTLTVVAKNLIEQLEGLGDTGDLYIAFASDPNMKSFDLMLYQLRVEMWGLFGGEKRLVMCQKFRINSDEQFRAHHGPEDTDPSPAT